MGSFITIAPNAPTEEPSIPSKIEEIARVIQHEEFLESLDRAREDVAAPAHFEAVIVGSTIAGSTGLSVGYVVWLIRGGALLASLVSSTPAWRAFDPLPVLAYMNKGSEEESEDQDSLDTIIQKRAKESNMRSRTMPVSESSPGTGPAPLPSHAHRVGAEGPG